MPQPNDHDTGPARRMHAASGLRLEHRAVGEGEGQPRPQIVGHAVVWDEWTTIYDGRYLKFREVIRPGAFTDALREKQDVRSLFNHDPNYVLGRTKAGTLALEQDGTGLLTRTEPPDTQTIRDLVLGPIGRGDVSGMSFAFTVRRGPKTTVVRDEKTGKTVIDRGGERITEYEEDNVTIIEREVLAANLFDVSPVTYPAYEGTDVGLRAELHGLPAELRDMIAEKDRPRRAAAPKRQQYRQFLDGAKSPR